MATLSVVLATYNEEKNISSCIESFKDIADEIIIADGTSTDETAKIAKDLGAKVVVVPNQSNFHINKQIAIDLATKDWILQMDADEHVSGPLAKEIKEKINQTDNPLSGYWIPRKNWFLGRFLMKGGQYPDYTLRLYRKGKGRLPQKDVHEQAIVEGEVGHTKQALLHYPYKDFSFYLSKWNRYVSFNAIQLRERGGLYNPLFALMQLIIMPIYWFLWTFIRHKGFMDLWQGFVFSFFSSLRYPAGYIKALRI